MCEFCQKHGQGNRWYLNPENFSDHLLDDRKRVETLEEVAGWGIDYYIDFTSKATNLINWPVIGRVVKRIVNPQNAIQVRSRKTREEISYPIVQR